MVYKWYILPIGDLYITDTTYYGNQKQLLIVMLELFFGLSPFQSRQNLRPVTLDAVTWQQQVLSTRSGSVFKTSDSFHANQRIDDLDSITDFFLFIFL